ncbi:hypothetical protein EUGRSUZ_C00198 [Eucalyptus grandis]|uniref:Uncharacterized protein n=2 Tax=Eucalyptus grandis TaxID=71139 RepID=A0ACC3L964_EUCGR|nr:hypothetical protein EUGRSUZ_C00198 [Eucalyptus grandis]
MLCGVHLTPQEHSIFKVRHQLREVNEKAYEPEILSIGPYNYGKEKFKSMEEQKMRYVRQMLLRRNEESVDRYMLTLRELEKPARNCYAENIDHLTPEEFLGMMFIDGCFIIELFRNYNMRQWRDRDDQLMEADWIKFSLRRDLLLLENQLPLFVLNKLYDQTKGLNEHLGLIDIATGYFNFDLGDSGRNQTLGESKHLLHLMHTCWTSGLPNARLQNSKTELDIFVSTATELKEHGVQLKAARGRHQMDIKFKNGILEIPVLIVEDDTESRFRNLIAYEQHRQCRDINYVTEYMSFMDFLINSSKDVKLLRHKGIIKNNLGDDEVVAQMFNKMGDWVALSDFYYDDISYRVNKYCNKKWNVRMAKLRRDYFHSPWAFFSVLAAISLLLLTTAQTVFTTPFFTEQK